MKISPTRTAPKVSHHDKKLLFRGKGKLYYWNYAEGKNLLMAKGEARIFRYKGGQKAMVSFLKSAKDTANPDFCADNTALNGHVHAALSIKRHIGSSDRAITFGKMPSVSYKNSDGRPLKTSWIVRFENSKDGEEDAECFENILNQLVEVEEGVRRSKVRGGNKKKKVGGNGTIVEGDEDADDDEKKPSGKENAVNKKGNGDGNYDGNDSDEEDDDVFYYDVALSQPIACRDPFADKDD
jgi:hypothetical protein